MIDMILPDGKGQQNEKKRQKKVWSGLTPV
jgi:hypothetical protein